MVFDFIKYSIEVDSILEIRMNRRYIFNKRDHDIYVNITRDIYLVFFDLTRNLFTNNSMKG